MALFYKYAKILNDFHTLQKEGRKAEAQALIDPLTSENLTKEERAKLNEAQKELVLYSSFVEEELKKPEYGTDNISGLLFSMGLGTPEQIERYNKALDVCIERYNISEPIQIEKDESVYSMLEPLKTENALALSMALKNIVIPLDQLSTTAFDFEELMRVKANNQMVLGANDSRIMYNVNFDALEDIGLSKKLTVYDKRVFEIVGTIAKNYYLDGTRTSPVTTLSQIYRDMGNLGKPGKEDRRKIEESLNKMNFTKLTINNWNVVVEDEEYGGHKNVGEAKRTKYPPFDCDNAQFISVAIFKPHNDNGNNNKLVVVNSVPYLMSYAIKHNNNITTIKREYLEVGINKNEATLKLEDYLLRRINQIKRGGTSNHIKFDTILEECKLNTSGHPERIWKKIKIFLDHYTETEFISKYKIDTDKGTIEIVYQKAAGQGAAGQQENQ